MPDAAAPVPARPASPVVATPRGPSPQARAHAEDLARFVEASPSSFHAAHEVVRRAVEAGLRFRPVEETIAGAADAPAEDGVGLTAEREAELLAAWHSR